MHWRREAGAMAGSSMQLSSLFGRASSDSVALRSAFVLLGTLFKFNSLPFNCGWALAAGWAARRGVMRRGLHWLDGLAGAMFAGFGIKLALTDIALRSPPSVKAPEPSIRCGWCTARVGHDRVGGGCPGDL
jgi:hypothetical protein